MAPPLQANDAQDRKQTDSQTADPLAPTQAGRIEGKRNVAPPGFDHAAEEVAVDAPHGAWLAVDVDGPTVVESLGYNQQLATVAVGAKFDLSRTVAAKGRGSGTTLRQGQRLFDQRGGLQGNASNIVIRVVAQPDLSDEIGSRQRPRDLPPVVVGRNESGDVVGRFAASHPADAKAPSRRSRPPVASRP